MTTEEIIHNIKKELRANMNGVASQYMRENGLGYHVNFGIELPRLRQIAAEFEPNHSVAQQLWHENVRESKILAGILMPTDSFCEEIADIWVEQIDTPEMAQMTVLNLFVRLPYASTKAFEWIANEREMTQLCGYLIIARLLMQGAELNDRSLEELKDQMQSVPANASLALRKVIMNIESQISPDK